ncbi:hypothetical protein N7G274_009236 [Stereocaulon virgatum]|uniref:Uncharacterized protein n=1 Tax=Stereocaulon virgatum TaxID=373712 RepID=A0ABR3ZZ87_9LECA
MWWMELTKRQWWWNDSAGDPVFRSFIAFICLLKRCVEVGGRKKSALSDAKTCMIGQIATLSYSIRASISPAARSYWCIMRCHRLPIAQFPNVGPLCSLCGTQKFVVNASQTTICAGLALTSPSSKILKLLI